MGSTILLLWIAVVVFALTNYLQRLDMLRRIRALEDALRQLRAGSAHLGGEGDGQDG